MADSDARPTLSVVIPALNEEERIEDAVSEVIEAIGDHFSDWELLLFNDGSTDRTGEIMDRLASENPRIRVTHNPTSRNVGGIYKQGVAMARHEYIVTIPGDNENPGSALQAPFEAVGRAEIVLPYPTNKHVRTPLRNTISRAYVLLLNGLFGLRVRYYNGTVIHRTENVRSIDISTDGFAFQSEVVIKLLRSGCDFTEVGVEISPPEGRTSQLLRLKNVIGVAEALAGLVVEVHGRNRLNPKRRGA